MRRRHSSRYDVPPYSSADESQQTSEERQLSSWLRYSYNQTNEETPQDGTDTPGCQPEGPAISIYNELSLLLDTDKYFQTLPGESGSGYYFLRKGVFPFRTEDERGKGYCSITVTEPNTPERRITAAWRELVPMFLDDFALESLDFPRNLLQGWRDSLPFLHGAGIERLENDTFFIHVWTSVETHENIDVKGHVDSIIKDITTRILKAGTHNTTWLKRHFGTHNFY